MPYTSHSVAVCSVTVAGASSLVGAAIPNSRLSQFTDEIEQGKVLLIVDVPEHKVQEVKGLVGRIHPEAVDRGVEVNVPVFP